MSNLIFLSVDDIAKQLPSDTTGLQMHVKSLWNVLVIQSAIYGNNVQKKIIKKNSDDDDNDEQTRNLPAVLSQAGLKPLHKGNKTVYKHDKYSHWVQ